MARAHKPHFVWIGIFMETKTMQDPPVVLEHP